MQKGGSTLSAKDLDDLLGSNRQRWAELAIIDAGLRNKWEPPYIPSEDRSNLAAEYNELIRRSELNILPLVVDAMVDRLKVVGFRNKPSSAKSDKTVWGWWQTSHLDQRQVLVHRDAAALRDGFLLVYPDGDIPRFQPESPLTMAVEQDPFNPMRIVRAAKQAGNRAWEYTEDAIITYEMGGGRGGRWKEISRIEHAGGACPVVRFPNQLDSMGRSMSEVEPVMPVQRRIHQSIMDRLLLQRSQAWRQRWVSGIVVDRDDEGRPLNPFKVGADRLLVGDNPDVKFGEFQQADLSGLLRAVDDDIRAVALITRTPPHYLPGSSISNISAEALTALEAALEARVAERKMLWGEAWESAMRVGGAMVGREIDDSAEVIWADLELRSDAQRVDAATKLASIGVPLEFLLERLSLSPQEIERIMAAAAKQAAEEAKAQAAAFGVDGVESNQPVMGGQDGNGNSQPPRG